MLFDAFYFLNILTELISTRNEAYQTRHFANIPSLSFKHNFFKNTFFPSTILEWNKLDLSLRNSGSYDVFKNSILKFIRKITKFSNVITQKESN